MNTAAGALLFVAFGVAVVDWVAVARAHRHLEQVAKPATMAMLVGAAALLSGTHPALQAAVTVGLALCGAGDVLLLDPDRWFVAGLGAFLLGHLAYIVGFALVLDSPVGILAGVAVVAAGIAVIGVRILAAVRRGDRALVVPITAYIGVLSAMVVVAWGTGSPVAAAGALLFFVSDATLAWNRFVRPLPQGRFVVIVTYHLAQLLLVIAVGTQLGQ